MNRIVCVSDAWDVLAAEGCLGGLAAARGAVVLVDQADRAISTGQLHALLRVHTRPIDVMVCHGSQGTLVWRGVSRLDAFSGYPVRT